MITDNKGKLRFAIELLIIIIISLAFIIIGHNMCPYSSIGEVEQGVVSAKVVKITDIRSESLEGMDSTVIVFDAELLSGEYEGQIVEMEQLINEVTIDKPKSVEEGDRILASNSNLAGTRESGASWYYLQQNRITGMLCLCGFFLLMLLIIGRLKGLTTIVALAFTGAAVFVVYIPAILSGMNVYLVTIVITIYIIFASLSLLNGLNKKTLCAIVGNLGGIFVAGVIAIFMNSILKITGLVDEGFIYLMADDETSFLNLKAIVWSGIIIGSLGAIMDVSMSIASAMQELAYEMKDRSFKRMVASGMNIGRDAIGTMTITLVLAYAGSSIASILLFTLNSRNLMILMNLEMIVVEVMQAIIGSLGILMAVPITVFVAASVFNNVKQETKTIDL